MANCVDGALTGLGVTNPSIINAQDSGFSNLKASGQ